MFREGLKPVNLIEYNKYEPEYANNIEIRNTVQVAIPGEIFWTKVINIFFLDDGSVDDKFIIAKVDNIINTVEYFKKDDVIAINIKNIYDHHDNEYIATRQARVYGG